MSASDRERQMTPGLEALEVIEADWTWIGDAFASGVQVEVDADGRIGRVGSLGLSPTRRLAGRALLPGMVNAHSHAFQRRLRGRGESFGAGSGSFWSWRREMYRLVEELDERALVDAASAAFAEMLGAGITTVGEFHYLHHSAAALASPGSTDFRADELVLEAATRSGIRIVLLEAYYRTGAPGQALAGAQRRFATPSPALYWRQMERLGAALDDRRQSLGAAVHSLRAAAPGELAELYQEARRRRLVFHLHAEEQRREIEEVEAAWGRRPLEILRAELPSAAGLTAVHCTHSAPADLVGLASHGGAICLCPTTEANLGDGIADLPTLLRCRARLSLGTDSNLRISMSEEMRWLEYVQRLAHERRGVVLDSAGRVAERLFETAGRGGAASLGLAAGAIAEGGLADFFTLDLDHPALAGWTPETLMASFVFGGAEGAIDATAVAGAWRDARET